MRKAVPAYALALTGCMANPPALDPLGYVEVARVSECGTAASRGVTNIVLGKELAERLLRLLPVERVDSPQCWYKHSDGLVGVEAGPFCEPTLYAFFRLVDSDWELETLNRQPIVLCHERVR